MNNYLRKDDTIIALSTPSGTGAVAMIRISGKDAFAISNLFFKKKDLNKQLSHTTHYGTITDKTDKIIDEVVLTVFKTHTHLPQKILLKFPVTPLPISSSRLSNFICLKG